MELNTLFLVAVVQVGANSPVEVKTWPGDPAAVCPITVAEEEKRTAPGMPSTVVPVPPLASVTVAKMVLRTTGAPPLKETSGADTSPVNEKLLPVIKVVAVLAFPAKVAVMVAAPKLPLSSRLTSELDWLAFVALSQTGAAFVPPEDKTKPAAPGANEENLPDPSLMMTALTSPSANL